MAMNVQAMLQGSDCRSLYR